MTVNGVGRGGGGGVGLGGEGEGEGGGTVMAVIKGTTDTAVRKGRQRSPSMGTAKMAVRMRHRLLSE